MAITFLAVGILWQNGIIDPAQFLGSSKPVKKDDIKPIVVKKPKTVSIQKPRPPEPQPRKEGDTNKKIVKSNEKILSYPYSLMLSSFRTPEKAKKAISIYNEKGLSPYLVKVEFKKMGVWYRVYTGYFLKYKQAKQFQQEHKLHGAVIKKTAYANLVGIDLSSDELYKKILSMKKLGYSPYVIEDQGGKTRLFLGAFLTREEAKKQYHDLKVRGIRSQVVER
jgi:cell division septation protein DedD